MKTPLLLGALLLGLAACNSASETGNGSERTEQANAILPANAAAPALPEAKAAAAGPRLVLDGTGLRLAESDHGQGGLLEFDSPMPETIQAVTRALGRPPGKRGTNEECGGGVQDYAEWKGDLILWFAEGRFVGWDSKGDLKTVDGLGLGSPRVPTRHFQVEQSSLGTEFTEGSGLSGLLESDAPKAKVAALWAGSTCVFR